MTQAVVGAAIVAGVTLTLSAAPASAPPASLMIWPIYPVMASQERAGAVWLENRGAMPATVQIRVLGWSQQHYEDRYRDQEAMVASPPLATIAPRQRQLIRLTRLDAQPAEHETAYRIIIDELPPLPTDEASRAQPDAAIGVRIRMRYSLPLFVHGRADGPIPRSSPIVAIQRPTGGASDTAEPALLSWQIVSDGATRWLQLKNDGPTHVRVSHVRMIIDGTGVDVASGLLGYVLSRSEMRWPVPESVPAIGAGVLEARVNGGVPLQFPHRDSSTNN